MQIMIHYTHTDIGKILVTLTIRTVLLCHTNVQLDKDVHEYHIIHQLYTDYRMVVHWEIELYFDIWIVPKLKHNVIIAGNPSGIAATPNATATLA